MKKIIILLAAAAVIGGHILAYAGDSASSGKVIAYYFHGSFRCPTCTAIEKYSREAIDVNFKDLLSSGKLEFKPVNVEEPANEHFVTEYQLYTKTLILSLVKDGKEIKSKNLDKIWEYSRNRQRFIGYVTEEVAGFLKDVK